MSKILIKSNPDFNRDVDSNLYLEVAEMFGDTVQGEGVNTGVPATFLRLQHCTLNCGWCVVAGTQILMSDFSYKNIEDIEIGDVVKTYTKKGLVDTAVINTLKRSSIDTVLVSTKNNKIQCSIDHRFVSYLNHTDSKKIQRRLVQAKDSLNSVVKTMFDGLEEVLKVEDMEKRDVFTLTTDQGYYIANNFLSKNCDSNEVWRYGNPYSVTEILKIWEENNFIERFRDGQHLVLTGGSPLKQQLGLIALIEEFIDRYGFKPYIEIENEAVLPAHPQMIKYVDCWNNSPKLKSSGNTSRARYKPDVISQLSRMNNAWFKFVVTEDSDWEEIKTTFIDSDLIRRDQIILMPEGATREELEDTRELTVNIAIREGVRFSDRQHVTIWNKKTGV